jgi:hypothetical protein
MKHFRASFASPSSGDDVMSSRTALRAYNNVGDQLHLLLKRLTGHSSRESFKFKFKLIVQLLM